SYSSYSWRFHSDSLVQFLLHTSFFILVHPFPTRRSSDLAGDGPWIPHAAVPRSLADMSREWSVVVAPDSFKGSLTAQDAAAAMADRKSTRLNSSHVKISYAVFCLKKKNSYRFN